MSTPLRVAALATLTLLVTACGERDRARHLALPVLADPSLAATPPVELADGPGCAVSELARVGARVTALLETGGELWIGTFDGGVYRLPAGEPLAAVPGLAGRERFVNALAESDGLVWAATQGGLLALDGDRRALEVLDGEGVTALAKACGTLYAGTPRGLFRVGVADGAEPVPANGPAGEPLRVTALAASGTRLWIGTASGAYSLPLATVEAPLLARAARWHPLVFGDAPAVTNVVTALAPVRDGAVAGTDDGGVVRLHDDGRVVAVRFADARANEVNPGAAAATIDGAAALGTQGGGLVVARARGDGLEVHRSGVLGRAEVSAVGWAGGALVVGTAGGTVVSCTPIDGG